MNELTRSWLEHFEYAAVSDVGMRRSNNQDSFMILLAEDEATWRSRGHLLVVADGMGAHAAGELASKLAVEQVAHHYRTLKQLSPPEAILQALRDTNTDIYQRGQANSEFHNMGTTCSALLLLPQGTLAGHVGDSRIYRVRNERVEQLTFDHSLLWEMRAAGSLSHQETLNIPKNVITRSLGPQASVQVDLEGPSEISEGDSFVLCSDGLTGRVSDDEIGAIVSTLPPEKAARLLVDMANLRGGPDNITVLIAKAAGPAAATQNWPTEPLRVGEEPPAKIHESVWVTLIVSAVVAAGAAIMKHWVGVGVASLAAAIAGAWGMWQKFSTARGVSLSGHRKLGKAPYVTESAKLSDGLLEQLTHSVRETAEMLAQTTVSEETSQPEPDETLSDELKRVSRCLETAEEKQREGDSAGAMKMLAVAARIVAEQFSQSASQF